jgi:hypothetical protein
MPTGILLPTTSRPPGVQATATRPGTTSPTRWSRTSDPPAGPVRDQFDSLAGLDVVDEPLVVVPNGVSQPMKTRTVETLGPDA